ncbi:hypothetical protein SVAN01_03487 [Stagonosporopsis vannaccii]|nr:hypothetical protein SVAN01_03487 [Stagonosporopsis vannaccii]
MKHFRSARKAVSPCTSSHHPQNPTFEPYNTPRTHPSYSTFVENSSGVTDDVGLLQDYLSLHDELDNVQANTSHQADIPSSSIDAQRTHFHEQQSPRLYNGSTPGSFPNHREHAGLNRRSHQSRSAQQHFIDTTACSPCNPRRRSVSVTGQRSAVALMATPPFPPIESYEAYNTPYSPYRGFFSTSDGARDHRHMITRFGRRPYIDPEDDHTIAEVEHSRNHQVGRIYDAMVRGDRAQDNPGSIAMKRWVHCAHYKSDLVEAFAHKVFDCLLVQVKEGFRGWHHNDYVDDDRKGEKEDREADCMNRLENIIDALEREKTICEDVVNSASQIRMFVNAPIAYAARKYQNRLGNSKRGRTKDASEAIARPPKVRRTGKRQTRARSTTVSDIPTSRDTTPRFQTPAATATPYYVTPSSPQFQSSPATKHLSPPQTLHRLEQPWPNMETAHGQATATAPPILTRPNIPSSAAPRSAMSPPLIPASHTYDTHRVPMPPAQMLSKQLSPVPMSSYHPALLSPDDAKDPVSSLRRDVQDTWSALDVFPPLSAELHSQLDPFVLSTTHQPYLAPAPHTPTTPSSFPTQYHDHDQDNDQAPTHVSLADIEHNSSIRTYSGGVQEGIGMGNLDPVAEFESFWNEQPGVQQFSFES